MHDERLRVWHDSHSSNRRNSSIARSRQGLFVVCDLTFHAGIVKVCADLTRVPSSPSPFTPCLETRNPKLQTRNTKHETRKPKTEDRKPGSRNPKPETRNPKPDTRNPKDATVLSGIRLFMRGLCRWMQFSWHAVLPLLLYYSPA